MSVSEKELCKSNEADSSSSVRHRKAIIALLVIAAVLIAALAGAWAMFGTQLTAAMTIEKPEKYAEYAGPPPFLCNDYVMFLLSPMFEPIMGMEQSTIYSMLPINDRKVGVILDASVTNPDMARDFGEYPIEDLQVPTLIFHAKDDKLASYIETERAVARFPNCTFISFESGGHLLTGHAEEIKEAVSDFVEDRSH